MSESGDTDKNKGKNADDKDQKVNIETNEEMTDTEDLTGLKANRDQILKEKKALQAKLDKLESDKTAAETKTLEEQKKFEELYEKQKDISDGFEAKLLEQSKRMIFNAEAAKRGFDISYSEFFYKEAEIVDGKMSDPESYFKTLKESKPALFTGATSDLIKTDTKKTSPLGEKGHVFTRGEIRDMTAEEYKKHKEAITAQESQGLNYGEKP
jgi:hypothetical protein